MKRDESEKLVEDFRLACEVMGNGVGFSSAAKEALIKMRNDAREALIAAMTRGEAEIDGLQAKLSRLPADWGKDSSLETWFPFTSEELARLRKQIDDYGVALLMIANGAESWEDIASDVLAKYGIPGPLPEPPAESSEIPELWSPDYSMTEPTAESQCPHPAEAMDGESVCRDCGKDLGVESREIPEAEVEAQHRRVE